MCGILGREIRFNTGSLLHGVKGSSNLLLNLEYPANIFYEKIMTEHIEEGQ